MQFFWDIDVVGVSLYTEPKAKLLSLTPVEPDKWLITCLGAKKELPAVSLDTAKVMAEQWLVNYLCDVIIELRRRNASVS